MKAYNIGSWIAVAAFIFLAIFGVTNSGSLSAASPIKHRDKCREKGINDALNMTLLVGAEMREQGKRPTWAEIQQVVRKRLGVK